MSWPIALALSTRLFAVRLSSAVRVEGAGAHFAGAAVYVHWHRYAPFLIAHHGAQRRWMLMGKAPYLEPMALWCRLHGLKTVPVGSASRTALLEALASGESVTIAVDGPKGPAFTPRDGCVRLAREAGVPIIPVAYSSRRGRTVSRRWDHSLLPTLLDRITVVYGAPIELDHATEDRELLRRVADGLDALERIVSAPPD